MRTAVTVNAGNDFCNPEWIPAMWNAEDFYKNPETGYGGVSWLAVILAIAYLGAAGKNNW